MAKVPSSLAAADATTGECGKKGCAVSHTSSHTLHRHHRKHEAMWTGVWAIRRRGEDRFAAFCFRYHEFNREDWVRLCDRHHAEIHLIYDDIIRKDKIVTGRPLSKYSWAQAEKLMAKLEAACVLWLEKETPGIDPNNLTALRDRRLTLKMNAKGEVKYVRTKNRRT